MSRLALLRLALLAVAVLTSTGCAPAIPEGRFSCAVDDDCPPGQVCRTDVERCHETRGEPDAPDGG